MTPASDAVADFKARVMEDPDAALTAIARTAVAIHVVMFTLGFVLGGLGMWVVLR